MLFVVVVVVVVGGGGGGVDVVVGWFGWCAVVVWFLLSFLLHDNVYIYIYTLHIQCSFCLGGFFGWLGWLVGWSVIVVAIPIYCCCFLCCCCRLFLLLLLSLLPLPLLQ